MLTRGAVSLEGRVAVVTGGGAGIGRAVLETFAEFGARVAVWERNQETAASAAADFGALACVTDVRDADQVDAALSRTVEKLGAPAILVNNSGGVFWSSPLETPR